MTADAKGGDISVAGEMFGGETSGRPGTNHVSSFLDEVEADSRMMNRDEYLAKKKQFEG